MLNLLVQGLPAKRKYSAITTYSPDMLRQRERKAKLFLVLTAARGRLDVVCEGNVRFSLCFTVIIRGVSQLPSFGLIHCGEKTGGRYILRNYLARVSPIPLSENLGWKKQRGVNYKECLR